MKTPKLTAEEEQLRQLLCEKNLALHQDDGVIKNVHNKNGCSILVPWSERTRDFGLGITEKHMERDVDKRRKR